MKRGPQSILPDALRCDREYPGDRLICELPLLVLLLCAIDSAAILPPRELRGKQSECALCKQQTNQLIAAAVPDRKYSLALCLAVSTTTL
jgi:tRNA-binding EMAP/Myf-like protein